jgi:hypothetical protein
LNRWILLASVAAGGALASARAGRCWISFGNGAGTRYRKTKVTSNEQISKER